MTQHLCDCGRPAPDATLCARCAHLLDAALAEICEYHGLGWDLDLARTRQARIGDRTASRTATIPLPYDERAGQAAAGLHNTLSTWARVIITETGAQPPADTITAIAAWLRPRAGWLRHHDAGAEALDAIRSAIRSARHAVDRPADRLYAGPCRACGTDLYARLEAAYIVCPGDECGTPWDVAELRAWLLDTAEDILATAAELSRALTRLAQPVTPEMIRGYVHRGGLAAHGTRREGKRDVALYRLGDVLDCVHRATAVRAS